MAFLESSMGEAESYISGCVDMENNCAFRANFYEKIPFCQFVTK